MKNNGNWLEIANIEKFADYIRGMVYFNFSLEEEEEIVDETKSEILENISDIDDFIKKLSKEDKQELDIILTTSECAMIIKENSRKIKHKKTKEIKYIINNRILNTIIEDVNQRMISNIVKGLVSKGLLESAFDDKLNDFVFWVKEDNKNDNKT